MVSIVTDSAEETVADAFPAESTANAVNEKTPSSAEILSEVRLLKVI